MTQFRGLHNPERHERNGLAAWCSDEEITCSESYPCRCCLAAEVKALRAENERLRRAFSRPKRLPPTDYSGMTG